MFEHQLLNIENIKALSAQHDNHEHFQFVVMPRLYFWLSVKHIVKGGENCEWTFRWSPSNVNRNVVAISLPDSRNEFHFYYAIPLVLQMKMFLYLGDNTFNFFEAYPLLIKNGVIADNEFKIDATLNSLPCLTLTKPQMGYGSLQHVENDSIDVLTNSKLHDTANLMEGYFEKFNQPLFNIINGVWML